ncbi:hypothetical protein [Nocardia tenerifensis]|uniref:hypothetical protein n=1 Tax=Nocardia tenerifensis TaxID=228006 RepID=UPI0011B6CE8C|nr:hypothetical protein [Nocardia tenerifensis]
MAAQHLAAQRPGGPPQLDGSAAQHLSGSAGQRLNGSAAATIDADTLSNANGSGLTLYAQ